MTKKVPDGDDSFLLYSEWYDAFYRDKDYQREADYVYRKVCEHIEPDSWLDVGCGTGRHLACLADKGLRVAGTDRSGEMIAQAKKAYPQLFLAVADAGRFHLEANFDAASLLFHVINYLTSEEDVLQALGNIRRHLVANGVLVFDFWHSGGVLNDPPRVTTRSREVNGRTLYRIARPTEDRSAKRVLVQYEFRLDHPEGELIHSESHDIRHYRVDELGEYLEKAGMQVLEVEGWMTNAPLGEREWFGLALARRGAAS